MKHSRIPDWDPLASNERSGQIALYDHWRRRCPVAHSEVFGWSLFRHADVMRVLEDPAQFSNRVSAHVSVPNGMDPPEHTRYRRIIEPYFSPERMTALEPRCRAIASDAVERLPAGGEIDVMAGFADDYALQAQCAFLNWPVELHRPLREWVRNNHEATRRRDRQAMAEVAFQFDRHIRQVLADRAEHPGQSDVASELLREKLGDRHLTQDEIVSILRNWTVGELGTIAACIGILMRFLANDGELQELLRGNPDLLPEAIDEILRIDGPLMTSRRVASSPVQIGDRQIEAGERLTLMWASANRDEQAFAEPERFRLGRDPSLNLLYGAGIHVCPGAPLARLELRVLLEQLLRTVELLPVQDKPAVPAIHPAGGYSNCFVRVRRRAP